MLKKGSVLVITAVIIIAIFTGCGKSSKLSEQSPTNTVQSQDSATKGQNTTVNGDNTSQTGDSSNNGAAEKAVAPEKNPPGDIPDSQVFVKYVSQSGGYELQVPEGWGRTEKGSDVKFVDKFDGIEVKISDTADTFSTENIKKNQVVNLEKTGRAVKVKKIKEVRLSGNQAVIVYYDSNSEPDSVTNKQIRLENESIYYYKNGKIAELVLWAPLGADNVDQWNLISKSFKWR